MRVISYFLDQPVFMFLFVPVNTYLALPLILEPAVNRLCYIVPICQSNNCVTVSATPGLIMCLMRTVTVFSPINYFQWKKS